MYKSSKAYLPHETTARFGCIPPNMIIYFCYNRRLFLPCPSFQVRVNVITDEFPKMFVPYVFKAVFAWGQHESQKRKKKHWANQRYAKPWALDHVILTKLLFTSLADNVIFTRLEFRREHRQRTFCVGLGLLGASRNRKSQKGRMGQREMVVGVHRVLAS